MFELSDGDENGEGADMTAVKELKHHHLASRGSRRRKVCGSGRI